MIYDIVPEQDLHGYANPWPGGAGANQWDEEWELGSITSEGALTPSTTEIRSKNHIPVSAETKYYIVTPDAMTVHYYEVDDTYISNEDVGSSKEITTPADCAYMLFSMADTYGTEYKDNIAFNYPSTVTTYSPYENICPITGVDVPGIGIVYAGSLDTVSRELTITKKGMKFKDIGWNAGGVGPDYFSSYSIDDIKAPVFDAAPTTICERYKVIATKSGGVSALSNGDMFVWTSKGLYLKDFKCTSLVDFKAATADTLCVYELATPVTVTLTEQQITALLGNLGVARNFSSAEIMVNVWLYMAQGRDPSDLTRQVLRPISKPIIDKPISLDDTVKELPADDVISPDEEPEENITEEKEEEDNASE